MLSVQKKNGLCRITSYLYPDSGAQTVGDYGKHKLRYAVAKQDYLVDTLFLIGQKFFTETKQMDVGP